MACMSLVVGATGGATKVTTGMLGGWVVVGAPMLTDFGAAVVTVTVFGSKTAVFVG